MAKIYTVRANGKVFKVRGPDNATPEQLQAITNPQTQREPKKTGLDKAVDISEKITGGIGKGIDFATKPIQKAEEASKGFGERTTEFLTEKGLPAPLAAAGGFSVSGPELVIKAGKVPFQALGKVQEGADFLGEKATDLATKLGAGPKTAASIGTGVTMLPDAAAAAFGAPPVLKAVKPAIKITPKQALLSSRTRQANLPGKALAKRAQAEELIGQAGKGLETAEKKAGIFVEGFRDAETAGLANAKKFKSFSQKVKDSITSDKGPNLVEAQRTQKLLGEGLNRNDIVNNLTGADKAAIKNTRKQLKDIIDKAEPEVAKARSAFKDAKQLVDNLPDIAKSERFAIKRQLEAARQGVEAQQASGIGGFVRSIILRALTPRIR